MMTTNNIFSIESFWNDYGTTSDYFERIKEIRRMIPLGTRNILDVGCGKGDVINELKRNNSTFQVFGVEPVFTAIESQELPCIQAVLPLIPFMDRAFDLVMCLQVLEHLKPADFGSALLEIQRLSNRYVIIGVPYNENLLSLQVSCNECKRLSHSYGHLRSFRHKDIVNLLSDFTMKESHLVGVKQRRNSTIGMLVQHRLANLYSCPEKFVCPYCNGKIPAKSDKSMMIGWLAKTFNQALRLFSFQVPYWIIALYTRKERATLNER